MSNAGIESTRGDIYQIYIAMDRAISILTGDKDCAIEIEATDTPVDDIVIHHKDGSKTYYQCKKNSPNSKNWSFSQIKTEIENAAQLLSQEPQAKIAFYSSSPFSFLKRLITHRHIYYETKSFEKNLAQDLYNDYQKIKEIVSLSNLDPLDFLQSVRCYTVELDSQKEQILRILQLCTTNAKVAFDTLYRVISETSGRVQQNKNGKYISCIDRKQLETFLNDAGVFFAPSLVEKELEQNFARISIIGRQWKRDIAKKQHKVPIIGEVLQAIQDKQSILLTGAPGSGKTCILLSVLEHIENQTKCTKIIPLYIQTREFIEKDRSVLGLSEDWVSQVAQMAQYKKVVVFFDSLDVLSLHREHGALKYFLAQMDQLRIIGNVVVLAACRSFDRKYDRSLSLRKWEIELECPSWEWDDVQSLLTESQVGVEAIDGTTREMLCNPKLLSIYLELISEQEGFSVSSSQELVMKYLEETVRKNFQLGNQAMTSLEQIANTMMIRRKIAISWPNENGLNDTIRQTLLSSGILQQTIGDKITFTHQILLDVLVVQGAIRSQNYTLNDFIAELQPVPFVRPFIRSFLYFLLAKHDRTEFRSQIRTVLTGNKAFHIRRLVAETVAAQAPKDSDWNMLKDLLENHIEIFHIIYIEASAIEWHRLWLKKLVPIYLRNQNHEAIMQHSYQISQWLKQDLKPVVNYWLQILELPWLRSDYKSQIASQIIRYLLSLNPEQLVLGKKLIEKLLSITVEKYSRQGDLLAQAMKAGLLSDRDLWHYIVKNLTEADILELHELPLRCGPNEFDSKDIFLQERMQQSPELLGMAVREIEDWAQIKIASGGQWRVEKDGLLQHTSYKYTHSKTDMFPCDNETLLVKALEKAILYHAQCHSEWWKKSRNFLAGSREAALRYFAILACTSAPEDNIDTISILFTEHIADFKYTFRYELGLLIKSSFYFLSPKVQQNIIEAIKTFRQEYEPEPWVNIYRAQIFSTIPCFLRPKPIQKFIEEQDAERGPIVFEARIHSNGGFVAPPFRFDEFFHWEDASIIKLLRSYQGQMQDPIHPLMGGEEAVAQELADASSRKPMRFMLLLLTCWHELADCFRKQILSGVAEHLEYLYGRIKPGKAWETIEQPKPEGLAILLIAELERHPEFWQHRSAAARAILACSHVLTENKAIARLIQLAQGFLNYSEPVFRSSSLGLIHDGMNMKKGKALESLIILANNLLEKEKSLNDLLISSLHSFAEVPEAAVRALLLRRLPYLQSKAPELGWSLFDVATKDYAPGLWKVAEPCLYYAIRDTWDKVSRYLAQIKHAQEEDLETWGRLSALAAITGKQSQSELYNELSRIQSLQAWKGAVAVWVVPENIAGYFSICQEALIQSLEQIPLDDTDFIIQDISRALDPKNSIAFEPRFFQALFSKLRQSPEKARHSIFHLDEWLNYYSLEDPENALEILELSLDYASTQQQNSWFLNAREYSQILTKLFAEAEEREESDNGFFLTRVIKVQDNLISLGANLTDWFKEAERP